MELEELKSIWNSKEEGVVSLLSKEDMHSIIRSKSLGTISRLKKKLWSKLVGISLCFFVVIASAVLVQFDPSEEKYLLETLSRDQYTIMMFLMMVLLLPFLRYTMKMYYELSRFQRSSDSLKLTLLKCLDMVTKLIRVGTNSDTIGVPIVVSFVLYIIFFGKQAFVPDVRVLVIPAVAFLTYRLVRWKVNHFQNEKYATFINSLKEHLGELEESQSMNTE